MKDFTPEQLIKYCILNLAFVWEDKTINDSLSPDDIDTLWDKTEYLEDAISGMREGEYETNLACKYSQHYEAKSVAAKAPNGQWVGWTYWYGGGKHGEPEAIDWMEDAYFLDCEEKEKLVVVRKFTKIEEK